jgi:hypothetical protein
MTKADLQKHTLNLHPGDYDKLAALFPDTGAGPIIRQLVHDFIARVEAEARATAEVEVKL